MATKSNEADQLLPLIELQSEEDSELKLMQAYAHLFRRRRLRIGGRRTPPSREQGSTLSTSSKKVLKSNKSEVTHAIANKNDAFNNLELGGNDYHEQQQQHEVNASVV